MFEILPNLLSSWEYYLTVANKEYRTKVNQPLKDHFKIVRTWSYYGNHNNCTYSVLMLCKEFLWFEIISIDSIIYRFNM